LGTSALRELFGDRSPLNQTLRIGVLSLKVVGVLESKGFNPLGVDEDDVIVVPLPVLLRDLLGQREPAVILCSAVSDNEVERAVGQIKDLLRQRHKIAEGDGDDFKVTTLKEKEQQARLVSDQMTLLMFFLALVSLAVGGVGIMNIMLVAVTERTREIGIRMAIGASTRAINRQFLVEASVISSAGGSVGILLGLVGAAAIARSIGVQPLMSPWLVLLAFAFSAGVGVVFGLMPARRAAALNPIEALRHD
jgi:putative ABC transport system permease protein